MNEVVNNTAKAAIADVMAFITNQNPKTLDQAIHSLEVAIAAREAAKAEAAKAEAARIIVQILTK